MAEIWDLLYSNVVIVEPCDARMAGSGGSQG